MEGIRGVVDHTVLYKSIFKWLPLFLVNIPQHLILFVFACFRYVVCCYCKYPILEFVLKNHCFYKRYYMIVRVPAVFHILLVGLLFCSTKFLCPLTFALTLFCGHHSSLSPLQILLKYFFSLVVNTLLFNCIFNDFSQIILKF